jgi:ribosome-binding protein aMBF1 (putative translation factor)
MMFSTNKFSLYGAVLGLTLTFLISSGVARGQGGNAGQSNPGYSGAPGAVNPNTIDDATLKQTAKAYVKVRQIVQKAEQDLNNTTDNAQQQQIAKQAESRKMAAVKAEGLQPQQYNQVIQLARVDKAFEQKFLSYVNEVKNSSS